MPWEGVEEKKQKQGTKNARLVNVLHVHKPDYTRMKTLLAYTKEWKVWHKHWGNSVFTVETPTEKSSQAEKTRYIQMIQIHGSVQLSMGTALLEGLINADTTFTIRLLSDVNRKARPPTSTSFQEIFSLMEINDKKVWIYLSTGSNGMSTGYFSSVVQEISEHVAAFIACPGAQVYWWLRRQGCITADVSKLIRHCFFLSQQQKVTESKYLKDLGLAVVDRTDGDNIIQATNSEGLTDLTLGLLDKERRSLVALQGYDAAAITYGNAKEGSVEAHNFFAALSVTSINLAKGKRVQEPQALTPTLVQSVYSIGTSKVTKDSEDESDEEEDDVKVDSGTGKHEIAINRMDILRNDGTHGAMLLMTASMEETSEQESKGKGGMDKDSASSKKSESTEEEEWQEEETCLTARMNVATAQLHLGSNEEGSNYHKDDMSIRSNDLDLNLQDYASNAQEVSSGEFDAAFTKKYTNPKSFLHVLWNAAGPLVKALVICLDILKEELEGQLAGVPAEFKDLPEQLIHFMHAEAGEDPNNAIAFIAQISHQISQFEDGTGEEDNGKLVKAVFYAGEEEEVSGEGDNGRHEMTTSKTGDVLVEDGLGIGKGGTQDGARKTKGTLSRAQRTSHAEGAVNEPAAEAGGDKERVQSMSMVPGR
jgi:hypothetical protein